VAPATAVSRSTPRRLRRFAEQVLGLKGYLRRPGDGRVRPQIAARHLLWAQLIGVILRHGAFHAVEFLVRSRARQALGVGRAFGDDALAYFTERLDMTCARRALTATAKRSKRNKAFENSRLIGLALDGTAAGRSRTPGCDLCSAQIQPGLGVVSYLHRLSALSVVGSSLVLPVDVEPYGPGDCELAASQRLIERTVPQLGPRFADYLVADGLYAAAPFLSRVRQLGLRAVVRLKANVPDLLHAVEARFGGHPPHQVFQHEGDRVEVWDADDFDPWEGLAWTTVRVLRYRQHRPDGTICTADWLTDFPIAQVGSRSLYAVAKSRWQIENGVFNDGKNRYGLEHIHHHQPTSLVITWLLICLALVVERLYRLRFLHRGTRPPRPAIELVRVLWLALGTPRHADSS
jgi:hypothetical protein